MIDLAILTFFLLCAGIAFAVIVHETRAAIRLGRAICRGLSL
jgi:hypothetical protein